MNSQASGARGCVEAARFFKNGLCISKQFGKTVDKAARDGDAVQRQFARSRRERGYRAFAAHAAARRGVKVSLQPFEIDLNALV